MTYHFDYRGSTVAITDASGSITDTFAYDTYGNLIERSGSSEVIFGYNGRDGVVSDGNGLIYMRARYYSPKFRRFVNADLVAGEITNGITLNRYAYANGNPVSNVDPFGLSAEDRDGDIVYDIPYGVYVDVVDLGVYVGLDLVKYAYKNEVRPQNIGIKVFEAERTLRLRKVAKASKYADDAFTFLAYAGVAMEVGQNAYENIKNSESAEKIMWEATVDTVISGTNTAVTVAVSNKVGATVGSFIPIPVVGTILGGLAGMGVGILLDNVLDSLSSGGRKEIKSWVQ